MTRPSSESPTSRAPLALWAIGGGVALAALFFALHALLGSPTELGPIRGVRLGLAPAMARSRFAPGTTGRFRVESEGADLTLVWDPSNPEASDLQEARLEFHEGLLVAVRLEVTDSSPEAAGPALVTTETSILSRDPIGPSLVRVSWLSRSCPTHADEVARRIAESGEG